MVHSALRNILFSSLKQFKEIEPRCKVQIIERSSNNVVDSVLGGECDLVLILLVNKNLELALKIYLWKIT